MVRGQGLLLSQLFIVVINFQNIVVRVNAFPLTSRWNVNTKIASPSFVLLSRRGNQKDNYNSYYTMDTTTIAITSVRRKSTRLNFVSLRHQETSKTTTAIGKVELHPHPNPNSYTYLKMKKHSESIEKLYRKAMEEDEEWYNSFVKDVLGEDDCMEKLTRGKGQQNLENKSFTTPIDDIGIRSNEGISNPNKERRGDGSFNINEKYESDYDEDGDLKIRKRRERRNFPTAVKDNNNDEARRSIRRPQQQQQRRREMDEISNTKNRRKMVEEDENENVSGEQEETSSQKDLASQKDADDVENNENKESTRSNENDDEYIIKFVDMFNIEQKVPMSTISQLGYKPSDVVKLRAEVLELIIEDEIPMPLDRDGIARVPRRWVVESRDEREVKILQKRRKKKIPSARASSNQMEDRYGYGESGKSRRRPPPRSSNKRRRRQSKRERKMEDNDDSKSSSIWMDIPTFKQYLRTEAELRLAILGPDWEDWVKGESDWRLNLYKSWLELVDNGVGDDMFEGISYAPAEMRSSSRNGSGVRSGNRNRKSRSRKRRGRMDEEMRESRRSRPRPGPRPRQQPSSEGEMWRTQRRSEERVPRMQLNDDDFVGDEDRYQRRRRRQNDDEYPAPERRKRVMNDLDDYDRRRIPRER